MEDINYSGNNNQFNFNSISELNKIYSSNGNDKQAWENLLISTYKSSSYNEIMSYLVQTIRNQPSNTLTLDIIDFMVDFGPQNLIKEISRVEFMNIFFNLLKRSSGSGPDVQKNGIYLTKKWKERADSNPNEKYDGFTNNFFVLSKNGISFPPSGYKIDTYEKYISEFAANIAKEKAEGNQIDFYNGTSFNNNNMNKNSKSNNNFQEGQSTPFGEENEFNLNDDIPSNEVANLDNFFTKMEHGQNDNNNNINNFNNMNRINNGGEDGKKNNISENKFISSGKMNNVNIINNINNLNDVEEENNGFPKIEDEDEFTSTPQPKEDFNPFILPKEIEDDEDDKNKHENNINNCEDVKKEENNIINDNNIIKEDNKIIDDNNNNKNKSKMMYPDYNENKNNNVEKMDDFGQNNSTPTGDIYLDANQFGNNASLRSKNNNFGNNINNFETPLNNKNSTWNNNNIIENRNNQYNFSDIIINNNGNSNFNNNNINFNNNNFNNNNNNNFNNNINNNFNKNNNNNFDNNNNNNFNNNINNNFDNNNNNNFNNNNNNNFNNNNFSNNNFNNNSNFNSNNNSNYNNYNNNNNNNFNNNSNINNNYYESDDPYLYKKTWMVRLELYNKWISDGELCYERKKLKDGIKSILDESKKIEYLLEKYSKNGDKEAIDIIHNINSDMFQTCSRYEKFINNKATEKFVSSFDGNKKKYSFKREKLYLDNNINVNNANKNNNQAKNTNENHHKGENKYIHGIKKFGGIMKSGIFTAGKAIKKNSLKGYNYVKEKINKDEDKMNNNSEEIWSNYMKNLEHNNESNFQNNQDNNNNNNNNNYNNYKSMINNNNYNNQNNNNYMNQNSSYQMSGQYSNYNNNNNNMNGFNNFNNNDNSNNNMNNYNNNNQNNFSNMNDRNSYNNYNNNKYF